MSDAKNRRLTAEGHAATPPLSSFREAPVTSAEPHTKLLLVDFRSGEAVAHHPKVMPLLQEGWHVKEATPRVTTEGTKLLVVLTQQPAAAHEAPRSGPAGPSS